MLQLNTFIFRRKKNPELTESIEKICYDVHENILRIKPNLNNAGALKFYKYVGLSGMSTRLAEQKYSNYQIERSRSPLIHMPWVKATKTAVAMAMKSIDRSIWMQRYEIHIH